MAVPCVKNYYGRTYFDEFMPTCLRGAVFLRHSVNKQNDFDRRGQYFEQKCVLVKRVWKITEFMPTCLRGASFFEAQCR